MAGRSRERRSGGKGSREKGSSQKKSWRGPRRQGLGALVPISNIMLELGRNDLLPGIIFRTSRVQCDQDVERAASNRALQIPKTERAAIKEAVGQVIEKYGLDEELVLGHTHYGALLNCGIGAHHAGQLLLWRLTLEELMSRGLLRGLVATGTVAAGVDFPARSVVITAHTRRDSEGYSTLSSSEFQQMSGRAGRRGKDAVGFCLMAPSIYCDARELSKVAKRPPEPLASNYFASASSILNLLKHRNVDDLYYTVNRSLASFMDCQEADQIEAKIEQMGEEADKKTLARLQKKASRLRKKQVRTLELSLAGLEKLGFVESNNLTEKGAWSAEICSSLVIEIAELIDEGLIKGSSIEEVAYKLALLSGVSHRTYLKGDQGKDFRKSLDSIQHAVDRVASCSLPGRVEELEALEDCGNTVLMWLNSESWSEFRALLNLGGVAEGDAARLISQTADQLNQLSHLEASHPDIARVATIAREKLLRPPLSETLATT